MINAWKTLTAEQHQIIKRILGSSLLLLIGFSWPQANLFNICCFLLAYLIAGLPVLKTAGRNLMHGKLFDENFLMSMATLGALAIQQWPEAVAVMLFYTIGDFFEDLAVNRSRRSITDLLDLRPETAHIIDDDQKLQTVDPATISVGDTLLVKPGEKVPLDGIVVDGSSYLNTAALTGETKPVLAEKGTSILSGTIAVNGTLKVKVQKTFNDSTVSKILELVENASEQKTNVENFITRFSRVYTPVVVLSAIILAILPPLFFNRSWLVWIYRALDFLVISCPCALVISVPLSYFSGIGAASKIGVLVKGSNFLEELQKINTIVFDKTGTLTKGEFSVIATAPVNIDSQQLIHLAALAEQSSPHPIAQALVKSDPLPKSSEQLTNVQEIVGYGVQANYQGKQLLVGNARLMKKNPVMGFQAVTPTTGTLVYVAYDGHYAGCLTVADTLKNDAAAAIKSLKQLGIKDIVMLTGDNYATAKNTADRLGINSFKAELLPQDKLRIVKEYQQQSIGKVAFVGDGLNDTPVLAGSDIGIAMGALGSDAAIEAADIVLMHDNPGAIPQVFSISQKTSRIAIENIVFALSIKGIFLVLAAVGIATMWEAVFADVGVTIIAVLNSLRLLRSAKYSIV